VGLAASLGAFFVLTGPGKLIGPGTDRHAVVFIAPTAFAFACLVQALVAKRPDGSGEGAMCRRTAVVSLVLGSALLLCAKANWFDLMATGKESLWTLRADVREVHEQALQLILHDHLGATRSKRVPSLRIVGQEYWVSKPLEYLASWRKDVYVDQLVTQEDIYVQMNNIEDRFEKRRQQAVDQLRSGAYLVGNSNRPAELGGCLIETAVRSGFDPNVVSRWEIPDQNGHPACYVYHIREVASTEGDVSGALPAGRIAGASDSSAARR
jgi:hypothetical protein